MKTTREKVAPIDAEVREIFDTLHDSFPHLDARQRADVIKRLLDLTRTRRPRRPITTRRIVHAEAVERAVADVLRAVIEVRVRRRRTLKQSRASLRKA